MAENENKTEKTERPCRGEHVVGCTCPTEQKPKQEQQPVAEEKKKPNWWKRGVLIGVGIFFGILILGWLLGQVAPKYYAAPNSGAAINNGGGGAYYQSAPNVPQPSARLTADLAQLKGSEDSLSVAEFWATRQSNADFADLARKRTAEWQDAQNAWRTYAQTYNAELTAEGLDKQPAATLKQMGLRPPVDTSQIPRWYTDGGQPIN